MYRVKLTGIPNLEQSKAQLLSIKVAALANLICL